MRIEEYEHGRRYREEFGDDRPMVLEACCKCNGPRPLNILNLCRRCAPGSTMVNYDPPIDTVFDREAEDRIASDQAFEMRRTL